MEVFDLRDNVVRDYADYVRSFIEIRDPRIERKVADDLRAGFLWPEPLAQLNPAFEPGSTAAQLVQKKLLHETCAAVFCDKPDPNTNNGPLRFHRHQIEGFEAARAGESYVLTTGTGSGKSLSYIVPIVDHVLRAGSGNGIQAVIVYPMNALANSQRGELEKYLVHGFGRPPVTFARYTGQETEDERDSIVQRPPDILLTNFVMLELILTRTREQRMVRQMGQLRFLVLDELHTYRGRQGADVAMLVRRLRDASGAKRLLHVGTSATMAGGSDWAEQQAQVAAVASHLFGSPVRPERVIGETLRRATADVDPSAPTDEIRAVVDGAALPTGFAAFVTHPMAGWVETNLGLVRETNGRLIRRPPRTLREAADELATTVGRDPAACEAAIRRTLMAGHAVRDEHRRPVFAFRLHQFVSKGESVFASPRPSSRSDGQQYAPGSDRKRVLLPLAFCRECGQDSLVRRQAGSSGTSRGTRASGITTTRTARPGSTTRRDEAWPGGPSGAPAPPPRLLARGARWADHRAAPPSGPTPRTVRVAPTAVGARANSSTSAPRSWSACNAARASLRKAAVATGSAGIRHEDLMQRVYDVLDLALDLYARNFEVMFGSSRTRSPSLLLPVPRPQARQPNLEQCGLLQIDDRSLDQVAQDPKPWVDKLPAHRLSRIQQKRGSKVLVGLVMHLAGVEEP